MDDYFESETMFNDEQRIEPGGEQTAAMETAQSWELRYLDDEAVVIDSESAARVGGEELARIGAAPVRCGDGNVRVVLADPTPERIAAVREHFSGSLDIAVVTASKLASLLDAESIRLRASETNAGDFVADAVRAATGSDVAIMNGDVIRRIRQ